MNNVNQEVKTLQEILNQINFDQINLAKLTTSSEGWREIKPNQIYSEISLASWNQINHPTALPSWPGVYAYYIATGDLADSCLWLDIGLNLKENYSDEYWNQACMEYPDMVIILYKILDNTISDPENILQQLQLFKQVAIDLLQPQWGIK